MLSSGVWRQNKSMQRYLVISGGFWYGKLKVSGSTWWYLVVSWWRLVQQKLRVVNVIWSCPLAFGTAK